MPLKGSHVSRSRPRILINPSSTSRAIRQNVTKWVSLSSPITILHDRSIFCFAEVRSGIPSIKTRAHALPFRENFLTCVSKSSNSLSCVIRLIAVLGSKTGPANFIGIADNRLANCSISFEANFPLSIASFRKTMILPDVLRRLILANSLSTRPIFSLASAKRRFENCTATLMSKRFLPIGGRHVDSRAANTA